MQFKNYINNNVCQITALTFCIFADALITVHCFSRGIFSHIGGKTTRRSSRVLEPNTYECPIRTIRTYWAEILIFDKKMRCSAQYVRMAMTLKILQVLIILPLKIYKFTKDNSTHGNFVQGQLDPRQFRPRTTRPTAISSKDNSTNGNFVQGQLDPR